jgi:Zn finger protein HypA/HybF involved in hydrogenase expression
MEWKTITENELKRLIDDNTIVDIGRMFGISDAAVKKKAKMMGIWEPRIRYNGHNDHLKGVSNKPKMYCRWCGNELNGKKAKKYCNTQCMKNYEHHIYINKWKIGLVDGSKKGYKISDFVKRYLLKKYGGKCSRCGWDTPNPYINKVILEVEHIDGDCTNNKEENLDLICPNCHSLTTTYKALNKGNGKRERLEYYKLYLKGV